MYSTFHVLIIGVDNKALYRLILAHCDKLLHVFASHFNAITIQYIK